MLCLGAHADDIEIGCGGTILRLLQEYPLAHIVWVVLSASGERAAEAERSAESFLVPARSKAVFVETFRDRYFPDQFAQLKDFFFEIARRCAPDIVLTHRLDDRHQDHHLVAELSWNTFRDQIILEYEIPKYEGDLGRPNVFFPISEELCRRKIDGVWDAFPSQHGKRWFSKDTFWATLRLRGLECNSESGLAEAFEARKMIL